MALKPEQVAPHITAEAVETLAHFAVTLHGSCTPQVMVQVLAAMLLTLPDSIKIAVDREQERLRLLAEPYFSA